MCSLCSVKLNSGAGEGEDVISCFSEVEADEEYMPKVRFWPQEYLPGASLGYESVGMVLDCRWNSAPREVGLCFRSSFGKVMEE